MSFTYTLHQINRSFEQIALCQEFLRRSEAAFRALHERVLRLEQQQQQQAAHGPTDEQVERVLRKILAERFGGVAGAQHGVHTGQTKANDFFVKHPEDSTCIPKAPPISPRLLVVDPEAVPSKAYAETFQMLERGLREFPRTEVSKSAVKDAASKDEEHFKRPELPQHNHARPW